MFQSVPDIRRKLQKTSLGPQMPMNQLLDIAFTIYNNQDRAEEMEKTQRNRQKAHMIAEVMSPLPHQKTLTLDI